MSRRFTAVCAGVRSRHEPVETPEVVLNGQDIDSAEAPFGGISARTVHDADIARRQGALPTPDHHRGPLPSSDQNTGGCGRFGSGPSPSGQPMRSGRPTAVPCLGLESPHDDPFMGRDDRAGTRPERRTPVRGSADIPLQAGCNPRAPRGWIDGTGVRQAGHLGEGVGL